MEANPLEGTCVPGSSLPPGAAQHLDDSVIPKFPPHVLALRELPAIAAPFAPWIWPFMFVSSTGKAALMARTTGVKPRWPLHELIADSALFRSKPPWAGLASGLCHCARWHELLITHAAAPDAHYVHRVAGQDAGQDAGAAAQGGPRGEYSAPYARSCAQERPSCALDAALRRLHIAFVGPRGDKTRFERARRASAGSTFLYTTLSDFIPHLYTARVKPAIEVGGQTRFYPGGPLAVCLVLPGRSHSPCASLCGPRPRSTAAS